MKPSSCFSSFLSTKRIGDIQRRWSEGEDAGGDGSQATAQGDALAEAAASSVPATLEPVRSDDEATQTRTSSLSHDSVDGAVVTVTSKPVCPIIPPPSVVEAAHQSGHVIRLHVKSMKDEEERTIIRSVLTFDSIILCAFR